MNRSRDFLSALPLALAAGCLGTPYDTGEGPDIDPPVPAFENGNLGGTVVLGRIADARNPTDEERPFLEQHLVSISGVPTDCDDPIVTFGHRNAFVVNPDRDGDRVLVLTPPGPVAGGKVEVAVSCGGGTTRLPDAYEYVLGDAVEADQQGAPVGRDGGAVRRLDDLFTDEYASFALYYQAEPFINWPDPVGYGFFNSAAAPRASQFFGQRPGLVYGGASAAQAFRSGDASPLYVPPQIPAVDFEQPTQDEELDGGPALEFFRRRDNTAEAEPLRLYARKARANNPLDPNADAPAPHTQQAPNNDGVWLVVPFEDASGSHQRYLRVAQWIGEWCVAGQQREGCTGGAGDEALNRTRLGVDFRYKWFTPNRPGADELASYPFVAPERIAHLDCVADGGTDESCEEQIGIGLPSGDYEGVYLVRSVDEFGQFPWEPDGFTVVLERFDTLRIEQGARYVDLPELAVGRMARDNSNVNRILYDGFEGMGENAIPQDQPVYVSYAGGFFRGFSVPGKNVDHVIPDVPPEPGSAAYDETPWIIVPPVAIETFFGSDSPFNPVDADGDAATNATPDPLYLGFPALLPEENAFDWRMSLPGGVPAVGGAARGDDMAAGWPDTWFVVDLSVRDLNASTGFGLQTPWKATAWAWAGDDFIVFPRETLQTLPAVADITRPEIETQKGDGLFGSISLEVHRAASWKLGTGFPDADGRAVVSIATISSFYFQNQHSCFDGLDNDGDGFCDRDGCRDAGNVFLPPDPGCIAPEGEDQPTTEVAACQNGEDDDGDGDVDADDADCDTSNDNDEGASCADLVDNDGDGWVDEDDPGCADAADSTEQDGPWPHSYGSACNDSIDNDGDGLIDAADPSCESGADDDEAGGTCADGVDNNGDGWVDADDLTCRPGSGFDGEVVYSPSDASAFECSSFSREVVLDENGIPVIGPDGSLMTEDRPTDEDEDGLANAADPDCAWGWDGSGEGAAPVACADRVDNDGDGWVDEADPGCLLDPESEATPLDGGTCANGVDDDGDGWIDQLDPDCYAGADAELSISGLACNNAVDDDGDGDVDGQDADCPTGKDNSEAE